jgi:ligand-binding SRPBCC domain-containing protein
VKVHRLDREQFVARPLGEVFEFFSRARNLEPLTPPFLRFQVLTPEPIEMRPGTLITYRLHLHRLALNWVTQIDAWEEGRSFVDRQLNGPYSLWHHRHDFEERDGGTLVSDHVHYGLPLGPLGEIAHELLVKRDLKTIFDFRQAAVARHLR